MRHRVIPCLQLRGGGLVKTKQFGRSTYVGDPIVAMKIFNDREADELVLLDIEATSRKSGPNFHLIKEIVSEAFMPVSYGGGIRTLAHAHELFGVGIEKVIINTGAADSPDLLSEIASRYGSQAVVVSVDYRTNWLGRRSVYVESGKRNTKRDPVGFAQDVVKRGAGEIIAHSIEHDGMMSGYDLEMISQIASAVPCPVIALGGAGSVDDLRQAVGKGNASAASAGSLFVFQGPHRAVLINYPSADVLSTI